MKKYRLARQAEEDLINIFVAGIERWGYAQAQQYAQELHECFELLANNPQIGQVRKELAGEPVSFVKGPHVIFYRIVKGVLEVSTILHQSMDVDTHFL